MEIDYKDILEEAYKEQFPNVEFFPCSFAYFVEMYDIAKDAVEKKWHPILMKWEFNSVGLGTVEYHDAREAYNKELENTKPVYAPANGSRFMERKDYATIDAFANFIKENKIIGPLSKKYPAEFFIEHYEEIDYTKYGE